MLLKNIVSRFLAIVAVTAIFGIKAAQIETPAPQQTVIAAAESSATAH